MHHTASATYLYPRRECTDHLDCLNFVKKRDGLKLHALAILENQLHMVIQSRDLHKSMTPFKQYRAKQILEMLKRENARTILEQLEFYKKARHREKGYRVWEEGFQPKLIESGETMKSKIDHIHHNPVKRGYVDEVEHWRYSSVSDCKGKDRLIAIEKSW